MKYRTAIFLGHLSPERTAFLRHALPNSVTILALFVGLTGLVYAANQEIVAAIACVLVAALLDACDGRVARATGCVSKFGAELDSLADVVCFGAVPAFILYTWGLSAYGGVGWLACLSLAGASALRLARFNVTAENVAKPSWANHFFTGIPAPGGAFLAMLPIYAANTSAISEAAAAKLALALVPVVAGLMVSTWPSFSAKSMSPKGSRLFFMSALLVAAAVVFGLMFDPWLTLTGCAAGYLCTLPLSKWRFDLRQRPASLP
ncbi:MAG TPA: phosphatidylcholine/phosphatidylserine synthase [Aestuariivirga sp.]|nr:phosphatidylcholine/phosphatidylserine synthase [Aestuariivirga sp.]